MPVMSIIALVALGLLVAWFVAAIAYTAAPSDTIIIPESEIPKISCSDSYSQVSDAELAQQRWTSCDMKGYLHLVPRILVDVAVAVAPIDLYAITVNALVTAGSQRAASCAADPARSMQISASPALPAWRANVPCALVNTH